MDSNKAAENFPELFAEIQEIIYQHDQTGLYSMGAARDEHDDSINTIISSLQHVNDSEGSVKILKEVLGGWILASDHDPNIVCRAMAPDI